MVYALQSSDFSPLSLMYLHWSEWQRWRWGVGLGRRYLYA